MHRRKKKKKKYSTKFSLILLYSNIVTGMRFASCQGLNPIGCMLWMSALFWSKFNVIERLPYNLAENQRGTYSCWTLQLLSLEIMAFFCALSCTCLAEVTLFLILTCAKQKQTEQISLNVYYWNIHSPCYKKRYKSSHCLHKHLQDILLWRSKQIMRLLWRIVK